MKKLLIGVVAVGVLLVAAILIAPSFIDWNAHKQKITALVREATGRDLTISRKYRCHAPAEPGLARRGRPPFEHPRRSLA